MKTQESIVQILAAYATIKCMADNPKYKNQYYILAEFIKYIIEEKKLYSFSISQMMEYLEDEFSFRIPYSVVKAALKKIDALSRVQTTYSVNASIQVDSLFSESSKALVSRTSRITESLHNYVLQSCPEGAWSETIDEEFVCYLLDKRDGETYQHSELISKFLLGIEDESAKQTLQTIREGSVLYSGLCYGIADTGSLKNDITFYLDTEVLFYIAGYDGRLSKTIADDFLNLVETINRKKRVVHLRFFSEVKKEIDRYFQAACDIVSQKKGIATSRAMISILNGCEHESDILEKKSDFFTVLANKYGIREDDKTEDYYRESNHQYNLESMDMVNPDNRKDEEALRFISHINVLRKGLSYSDYCNCKYLLITETRRVQEYSDLLRPQQMCGFALPLSKITDIIWFKLGMGFGENNYPVNSQIAIKARMILGISIASNVNKYFAQAIDDYKHGKIDKEMALGRIQILQKKITDSSEIDESNVDELLDFTPEELQKYDDAIRLGEEAIQNKEQVIRGLEETVGQKDFIITSLTAETKAKDDRIQEQEETIQAKNKEIATLQKREQDRIDKRKRTKKICMRWIIAVSIIAVAVGIFFLLRMLPEGNLIREIGSYIIGLIAVYSGVCTIFPKANVFSRIRTRKNDV